MAIHCGSCVRIIIPYINTIPCMALSETYVMQVHLSQITKNCLSAVLATPYMYMYIKDNDSDNDN